MNLDLGGLENGAGVHEAAVKVLTPVHADMLSRLGAQHPLTISAVSELALAHLRLGQSKALRHWLQQLRGSTGPGDAWRDDHAATLDALETMYSGQAARAEPELRRLLAALLRDEGGVTASTEPVRRMHAESLLRLDRTKEAETELWLTLKNQQRLSRADHPSIATTRVLLGVALARRGELTAARQHWESAESVLRKELGPQHPFSLVAACYGALGAADATSVTSRKVLLADQLLQRLGWQHGSADLAAALRSVQQPPDWSRLPAVL